MIGVIDASVAVRWYLEEECDAGAEAVLARLVDSPTSFAVPELFSFEVLAVLARLHPSAVETYRAGVLVLLEGGLLRYPMTDELLREAEPLLRAGLTGYDACYAALARILGGVWLTYDAKAHRRLAGSGLSHLLTEGLPPGW